MFLARLLDFCNLEISIDKIYDIRIQDDLVRLSTLWGWLGLINFVGMMGFWMVVDTMEECWFKSLPNV